MVDMIRRNAPELYPELLWCMRVSSQVENSRNGRVKTLQSPFTVGIENPEERMLFDPERCANPFFHIAETVWMLAGERHVGWLKQFNKNYVNYAEANGLVHGAYGDRWTSWFGMNQIQTVIERLRKDREDRRCVIGMWDPEYDLQDMLETPYKDVPCNTHIYFRIVDGKLDMHVCNRSNDLIWGMMGANVVHMTILQEIIAWNIGLPLGYYFVTTNNLHVYEPHWPLLDHPAEYDRYHKGVKTFPIEGEWEKIQADCMRIISGEEPVEGIEWIDTVAYQVIQAYLQKDAREKIIDRIGAEDVQVACQLWTEWKADETKHNL